MAANEPSYKIDPVLEMAHVNGLLDDAACDEIADEHQRNGKSVRDIIVDGGYIAEDDLLFEVAVQLRRGLSGRDVAVREEIDAGHGGRAVGANKQGINEKDIDLAIVLKLKEIFDNSDQNIGVYYTRTDDSNPTFDQRVQLANKSDADLFISIHNNSTRSGRMSGTSGTQVMYDETSEASRQFAQICLEEVTGRIGSRDKGLVEGDSIYIIRTSEVPVALIEVGFMTNKDELEKLNSDAYQRETAEGVYQAVLRAFEEGY